MSSRIVLALTRVSLGWVMFYAGITKIMNPNWSASGYLKGAKTFSGFYTYLTDPSILPVINFVNEWGLTLLGISLILGIGVRLSSVLGAVLMLMYYFPSLDFPKIGTTAYIIDEHIIYALVMIYFATVRDSRGYGLEDWFSRTFLSRSPKLQNLKGNS